MNSYLDITASVIITFCLIYYITTTRTFSFMHCRGIETPLLTVGESDPELMHEIVLCFCVCLTSC